MPKKHKIYESVDSSIDALAKIAYDQWCEMNTIDHDWVNLDSHQKDIWKVICSRVVEVVMINPLLARKSQLYFEKTHVQSITLKQ